MQTPDHAARLLEITRSITKYGDECQLSLAQTITTPHNEGTLSRHPSQRL